MEPGFLSNLVLEFRCFKMNEVVDLSRPYVKLDLRASGHIIIPGHFPL